MISRLYWRCFAWGLLPLPPLSPFRLWRARRITRRALRTYQRGRTL